MAQSTINILDLIGKTVSFELYTVGVLSNDYDNVVIDGVISAQDCDKYGVDAYSLHAQVYRQIPEGTMKDDAESYRYIVVRFSNGNKTILGIPWINLDTVQTHNQLTAVFTVTDIKQGDVNRIADIIKRHGYHVKFDLR